MGRRAHRPGESLDSRGAFRASVDRRRRGRRARAHQRAGVHVGPDAAPAIAGDTGRAQHARYHQPHVTFAGGTAKRRSANSGSGSDRRAKCRQSRGHRAIWPRSRSRRDSETCTIESHRVARSFRSTLRSRVFHRRRAGATRVSDSANSRGTTGLVQDALKIWHPFTRVGVDAPPLEVVRGEGPWLYTADGRRILDAISSWWVNLHGHAHPRIAEAIAQQARQLEHGLLAGVTRVPVERLAHELREFLPPALEHIFFSDDGSTAVEVALKLALQYWRNSGHAEKREIVALEHGYHGDTAGAMSVSDDSLFTAAFTPMRFPVHRAHAAYCYRCPVGLKRETCHIECADSLERILADRGGQVAAVIVEPLLQGAGGVIVHPLEYLQRVGAITARHGVLPID